MSTDEKDKLQENGQLQGHQTLIDFVSAND
jgi:hypothetical protein